MNFLKHPFAQFPSPDLCPTNESTDYVHCTEESKNKQNKLKKWVPYNVQFIGLFGFIWLLYKFIFCAILASSCCVKKYTWKIDGKYRHSNFILAISYFPWIWSQFSKFVSPKYNFLHFAHIFLYYRMAVMCLEQQKFRHYRWFHIIWNVVIIYRFIACRMSKFILW